MSRNTRTDTRARWWRSIVAVALAAIMASALSVSLAPSVSARASAPAVASQIVDAGQQSGGPAPAAPRHVTTALADHDTTVQARKKKKSRNFGKYIVGAVCIVAVIGAIVLLLVLNRRRKR